MGLVLASTMRRRPGIAEQTAPNDAHRAIATLQHGNNAWRLITQNVDRLHQAAGATEGLELHGSTHDVTCMKCGHLSDRKRLQRQLADLNPRLAAAADGVGGGAPGCVSTTGLEKECGWTRGRVDAALGELVKRGMALVDDGDPSGSERLYWIPCVSPQMTS